MDKRDPKGIRARILRVPRSVTEARFPWSRSNRNPGAPVSDFADRRVERALRAALCDGHAKSRELLSAYHTLGTEDGAFISTPDQHIGDEARPQDIEVHRVIEDSLRASLPGVDVIGEEAMRALHRRPGDLVAVVDPIDGTAPFNSLGAAFASVVLLLVRVHNDWEVACAGIASSTGTLVLLSGRKRVTVGLVDRHPSQDVVAVEVLPHREPLTLATVGAKPQGRQAFEQLSTALRRLDPSAIMFNVGGNPLAWGVVAGELDAVVALEPQTTWDAVYALVIAECGGTIGSLQGQKLDTRDFARRFQQISNDKVIPAHIAAKGPEELDRAARAIAEARADAS